VLTLAGVAGLALAAAAVAGPKTADNLAAIEKVQKEGVGNDAARTAWKQLVADAAPEDLPDILAAFDSDKPLVANWLRTAVDAVAEKAVAARKPLPAKELQAFALDRKRDPSARRLAYELLLKADPSAAERLVPGFIDDPSRELRRDAIAAATDKARELLAAGKKEEAKAAFRKVFASARDRDQADGLADTLSKEFGEKVDLPAHYGFVTRWHLIAPFDNTDKAGFLKPFPPEEKVDLTAPVAGKDGKQVRWQAYATADDHGAVDLNKVYKAEGEAKPGRKHTENLHWSVAYAYAVVDSPEARTCQVRVGSNNAVRVFLNGKPVLSRESYHMGDRMDQYVGRVDLKKGANTILVKVCQNDQDDDWAQKWGFQLRLCDEVGGAVPFQVTDPKPEGK
jgi:hypothetical protein